MDSSSLSASMAVRSNSSSKPVYPSAGNRFRVTWSAMKRISGTMVLRQKKRSAAFTLEKVARSRSDNKGLGTP